MHACIQCKGRQGTVAKDFSSVCLVEWGPSSHDSAADSSQAQRQAEAGKGLTVTIERLMRDGDCDKADKREFDSAQGERKKRNRPRKLNAKHIKKVTMIFSNYLTVQLDLV